MYIKKYHPSYCIENMTSTIMNNNPTYGEWMASLSPEDRKKYRDCENARMRKFYQENYAQGKLPNMQ